MLLKSYYLYLAWQVYWSSQICRMRSSFLLTFLLYNPFCVLAALYDWYFISNHSFFFFTDRATYYFIVELPRGPVGQILCLEKEVVVLEKNRLLMSPLFGCFFSWGFPDNSCVFGNYSTEKVCACDTIMYF